MPNFFRASGRTRSSLAIPGLAAVLDFCSCLRFTFALKLR